MSSNNYWNKDAKMKTALSDRLGALFLMVSLSMAATIVAAEPPSKEHTLLVKGGEALKKGQAQKAITEYFDPVILHYTDIYKGETKRVYSARSQVQAIMYVALPDDKKLGTEVIGGTWAMRIL
jgi:hypothetical protein